MNKSKDLRELFRLSLRNHNKMSSPMYRSNNNVSGGILENIHRVPGQYEQEIQFGKEIRIYFYEWSDISKAPRCFYSLDAFDVFLKTSGITLELYQKDIITNLGTVYVSCYHGTRNLNVRGNYRGLLESMNEHNKREMVNCISTNKAPMIIHEVENRWPENDGTFFG